MQIFPDWTGAEEAAWDVALVNGVRIPGIVSIAAEYGGGLKAEKGPQLNGAYVRDTGLDLAKFTVTITLPDANAAREWSDFYLTVFPGRAAAPRKPVFLMHPAVSTLGIFQVIIDKITFTTPTKGQALVIVMACLEFQKPKPVLKRAIPTTPIKGSPDTQITDPRNVAPSIDGPQRYWG